MLTHRAYSKDPKVAMSMNKRRDTGNLFTSPGSSQEHLSICVRSRVRSKNYLVVIEYVFKRPAFITRVHGNGEHGELTYTRAIDALSTIRCNTTRRDACYYVILEIRLT
jgi:hypothetical protein